MPNPTLGTEAMATIRIRYVKHYLDRHGKPRFYFRRKGCQPTPLPGLPGSPEFQEAYQAAMAGKPPPAKNEAIAPGTVSDLIAKYLATAEYKQLADISRTTYFNILKRFRDEHGSKPVARLEREHIKKMLDKKADTPVAANNLLKVLRILMKVAIDEKMRKDDPTIGIKKLRVKSDGFYTWTEGDIAKFEERYPIGSRERLAFALLLYTAQRKGDMIRMGWQHVRGESIAVKQSKTNASLEIPLHPDLRAVLEGTPKKNLTFVMTHYNKPFTAAGFGNWFRDVCDKAGLPECSAHGLRKAASRRLAEAGCTTKQIMAVTGHKSLDEIETYTRAAEQRRMALDAIGRLDTSGKNALEINAATERG